MQKNEDNAKFRSQVLYPAQVHHSNIHIFSYCIDNEQNTVSVKHNFLSTTEGKYFKQQVRE